MRIVYKGNYIRMTCGEIGLVYLDVIFKEWNAANNSCIRRISNGIGLQCLRESHIKPNMVLYKKYI